MISFYIAVLMIGTCTVKAQDDDKSIIHKIGFDVRPSYVAPTSKFLKDDGYGNGLTLRKAASFHLKYGFQQNPNSKEGQLYPHTYQGIGISYNTFGNRQEVGNPWAAYVFQSSRIAKISSRLSFDYEWNFGASFGWHPYDENNNYRNKIIGSKINAYINLGFFLKRETIPLLQPARRGGFNALLKRKYSSSECGIKYDWRPDRTRLHAQSYRGKPS